MDLLKKHQLELIVFFGLVLFYFALRLPNLTLQPVFCDEAIYIRWSQVMKAEPSLRFLPLTDGKTPLFMWAMMPFFKLFEDPLVAGRILSVLSGLVTLAGVIFLSQRFFNRSTAFWSGLLVVIVPFMLFFDRLALVDSMLAAFSIWSLTFALLIVQNPRFDLAMGLGYFLGGAILTKTPGMFDMIVLPVTLLTIPKGSRFKKILRVIIFLGIALIIGLIMYNLLRLGTGFEKLSSRNQDYIFSPVELIKHPLDPFLPHSADVIDWLEKLLTWPVLLVTLLGAGLAIVKRHKTALVILLWSLVPIIVETSMLKSYTARYILFAIPPLLIISGWTLSQISERFKFNKAITYGLLLLLILPLSLKFDFQLLTDPASAPLPAQERRGYFEDWTAGHGLKEIARYLIEQSKQKTVVVGTEGIFGTLPDGLMIYLDKHSHTAPRTNQVIVVGGKAEVSDMLRDSANEQPTYFVANKSRFPKALPGMKLIKEFPKAQNPKFPQDAMLLFQILPSK